MGAKKSVFRICFWSKMQFEATDYCLPIYYMYGLIASDFSYKKHVTLKFFSCTLKIFTHICGAKTKVMNTVLGHNYWWWRLQISICE